jgi:hypothetical protein
MPCNLAVSITKAGVTKPQLLALLTPDIVKKAVRAYLQQQYPEHSLRVLYLTADGVELILGTTRIFIENGRVWVSDPYGDETLVEALASEVEQFVLQLADGLFQQKLQELLGDAVTQTQIVNVDNEGVVQQATVFTLEF